MAKFSATLYFVLEADNEEAVETILDRINAVPGVVDTDIEVALNELPEDPEEDED